MTVHEGGHQFEVNLSDYLDTGLFLDHRITRGMVQKEAAGKRFLNLFGYTGAFTVYAAAGGAAETTTVDLSSTYSQWAERNLKLQWICWLASPNNPLRRHAISTPHDSRPRRRIRSGGSRSADLLQQQEHAEHLGCRSRPCRAIELGARAAFARRKDLLLDKLPQIQISGRRDCRREYPRDQSPNCPARFSQQTGSSLLDRCSEEGEN